MIANRCVVASFIDADEQYGAYVYTPAGAYVITSRSIGLLAEACEAAAKAAIVSLGREFDRKTLEWRWLGLLADTSPAHVGELMATYAE